MLQLACWWPFLPGGRRDSGARGVGASLPSRRRGCFPTVPSAPPQLEQRLLAEEVGEPAGAAPGGALAVLVHRQPLLHHVRSEEHTSELQSRQYLVCRLLL